MTKYINASEIVKAISSTRIYLMGSALLAVMLFHLGVPPFSQVGYWGVDVFLFVSGFGIYHSFKKNSVNTQFYLRRFCRVLPSAILCGWLFYFLDCAHGTRSLCLIGLNLWYIRTIILFYIVSPFVLKGLFKWGSRAFVGFFLISIISCALLLYCPIFHGVKSSIYTTFTWSISRFPIYLVGLYLPLWAAEDKAINFRWLLLWALLGGIILYGLRLWQLCHGIREEMLLFMPSILLLPAMLVVSHVFFTFLNRIPKIVTMVLSLMGSLSLEIYLVHESLFQWKYFSSLLISSSTIIHLLTKIALSIFLGLVINKLVQALKKHIIIHQQS